MIKLCAFILACYTQIFTILIRMKLIWTFFWGVYVVVVDGRHLWVFIVLPSPLKSIKFSLFSITTHIKVPFWLFPSSIFTRQGHESLQQSEAIKRTHINVQGPHICSPAPVASVLKMTKYKFAMRFKDLMKPDSYSELWWMRRGMLCTRLAWFLSKYEAKHLWKWQELCSGGSKCCRHHLASVYACRPLPV